MTSGYAQTLQKTIIAASLADTWTTAVLEWTVSALEEDIKGQGECVCGKTHLVRLFTITNKHTQKTLYPVGSECVKRFDRKELRDQAKILVKILILRNAMNDGTAEITSKYFPRDLLDYFYDEGVFTPDQYNKNFGGGDHEFLLKMTRKRNKDAITQFQYFKIAFLMKNKVVPFVQNHPGI